MAATLILCLFFLLYLPKHFLERIKQFRFILFVFCFVKKKSEKICMDGEAPDTTQKFFFSLALFLQFFPEWLPPPPIMIQIMHHNTAVLCVKSEEDKITAFFFPSACVR